MVIITNRRQSSSPNFGNLVISEENLFQTILDLFLAGTDTTTGTLRWILLRLIHNPRVQTKCREEILKVRKSNRILYKINLFWFDGSKRVARDASPPPVQFLSLLCNIRQKSCFLLRGCLPRLGNPGSATALHPIRVL